MVRDQNGNPVARNIQKVRLPNGTTGWAATCWFGGYYGPATNITRHVYKTREAARNADISHDWKHPDMLAFNVRD